MPKNPHAVALGRKGGRKAAQTRKGKHLLNLSPEELSRRGKAAAEARWGKRKSAAPKT